MKIKFDGNYISKKGNATFRYTVHGDAKELANYKKVLGDNHKHQDDDATKPSLFFSIKRYNDNTELALTRDGKKYYAQTELLEKVVENHVNRLKATAHVLGMDVRKFALAMNGMDDDI